METEINPLEQNLHNLLYQALRNPGRASRVAGEGDKVPVTGTLQPPFARATLGSSADC